MAASSGKTLDEPWTVYPIGEEPTVHRIRFADLDGSGKPALIVGPLMGRDSTAAKNWMDGSPVRLLAYRIPQDPARDRWVPEVIDESLHVMHNFRPVPPPTRQGHGRADGQLRGRARLLAPDEQVDARRKIGTGNQDNPKGNRGASEIKRASSRAARPFIATIEPWHGNQVVVYTPPETGEGLWERHVIDEKLKWGHAVWCADLDGDGDDELIIGVRDDLSDEARRAPRRAHLQGDRRQGREVGAAARRRGRRGGGGPGRRRPRRRRQDRHRRRRPGDARTCGSTGIKGAK